MERRAIAALLVEVSRIEPNAECRRESLLPPELHDLVARIEGPVDSLDLVEAMKGRVSFIEWPDSLPELKSIATAVVTIEFDGDQRRATTSRL